MTYSQASLAQGKVGEKQFESFLDERDIPHRYLDDEVDQAFRGDFELVWSKQTVEVKCQRLLPREYPEFFVEVCKLSTNPARRGGVTQLAALLRIDTAYIRRTLTLDHEQPLAISVLPLLHSNAIYCYVSADLTNLWLVSPAFMRAHILGFLLDRGGFVHAPGNAEPGTLGVFMPWTDLHWHRPGPAGPWRYAGDGPLEVSSLAQAMRLPC